MGIQFPENPQNNDVYTFNNRSFVFNGTKWAPVKRGTPIEVNVQSDVNVSVAAPENPDNGKMWLDTSTGILKVFYQTEWRSIVFEGNDSLSVGSIISNSISANAVAVADSISSTSLIADTLTANVSANVATINADVTNDAKGEIRKVPVEVKSSAYTLVSTDSGKCISTTSGDVTVASGAFSSGESVSVYNAGSSDINLVQGAGTTVYLVGDGGTGNRVLAAKGLATIFCVAADTFVCTGGGVS